MHPNTDRGREERERRTRLLEVVPGVTVASSRRFKAALIGPTQGLPKRRRLCPIETPETLKVRRVL